MLGVTVIYTLDKDDIATIVRRRAASGAEGNEHHKGDRLAAIVVGTGVHDWSELNLKVLLDGEDVLWKPGVTEGDDYGCWSLPVE